MKRIKILKYIVLISFGYYRCVLSEESQKKLVEIFMQSADQLRQEWKDIAISKDVTQARGNVLSLIGVPTGLKDVFSDAMITSMVKCVEGLCIDYAQMIVKLYQTKPELIDLSLQGIASYAMLDGLNLYHKLGFGAINTTTSDHNAAGGVMFSFNSINTADLNAIGCVRMR